MSPSSEAPRLNRIREQKDFISPGQLDLRIRFASAIVQKTGAPLAETLFRYTDLHQRLLGHRPPRFDTPSSAWNTYATAVNGAEDPDGILEATLQFSQEPHDAEQRAPRKMYGTFGYDYLENTRAVAMTFAAVPASDPSQEQDRLLGAEQINRRKGDLKTMFTDVKYLYPDAKQVEGVSWLYNLKAYCDAFPPSYIESKQIYRGDFQGLSRWGQFIDRNGGVSEKRKEEFFENISHLDLNDLQSAFPLPTWRCEGNVEDFYKFYDVE